MRLNWQRSKPIGRKAAASAPSVAVHRVQNAAQYRRFHQSGMALNESNEPAQLKSIVYHGTCRNSPWLICESDSGFDPSKGQVAPGSVSASCGSAQSRSCQR